MTCAHGTFRSYDVAQKVVLSEIAPWPYLTVARRIAMRQALIVRSHGLAADASKWLQTHVQVPAICSNPSWLTIILLLWKLCDFIRMIVAVCRW